MLRNKRKSIFNCRRIRNLAALWMMLCLAVFFLMKEDVKAAERNASSENPSFLFELTVDGNREKKTEKGDIITVTLRLKRTDSSDDYMMYAMQDEIHYDSAFLELVEDSVMLSEGVVFTNLTMTDSSKALYMNYLSVNGGEEWKADRLVGSFQMKVIGESGSCLVSNKECLVSTKDGLGSYDSGADDVTVILSEEPESSAASEEISQEDPKEETKNAEAAEAKESAVRSPATNQESVPVMFMLLLLLLLILLVLVIWRCVEKNRRS